MQDENNSADEIVLEGTFSVNSKEANNWHGFKGRIIQDKGRHLIRIKLTYKKGDKNAKYEMMEDLFKEQYQQKITKKMLKELNADDELLSKFEKKADGANLITDYKDELLEFDPLIDKPRRKRWGKNPGGISQNITSRFPRIIFIPPNDQSSQLEYKGNSPIHELLSAIFEDALEKSENYRKMVELLENIRKEMDTKSPNTELGRLMDDINKAVNIVFQNIKLQANMNLAELQNILKPKFETKLGSNVMTSIKNQGTGLIRTTVFALLKYLHNWKRAREPKKRQKLIIIFDEPEIYLHPNAIAQMTELIYKFAKEDQVICTSHSPFSIDLSREKTEQIVHRFEINSGELQVFQSNITTGFNKATQEDQQYVKFLIALNENLSRIFFSEKIIIIEGDTEEIVFKSTFSVIDEESVNKFKSKITIVEVKRQFLRF